MAQVVMYDVEPDPIYPPKRDYLQGRLYKKLSAGKRYCVSFYVCLEEVSVAGVKEISAYLDNGSIDTAVNCNYPQTRYIPQISNTGGAITDTMHWTKIEGSFIANGIERFITIGNFKDKAHTTVVPLAPNSYSTQEPYWGLYLVDDVSVVESDLQADAGPDKHVGKGDSIYIGRPKEAGLECTWSVLGSTAIIGTGAGIWVKPATTTSYVVTQTLCGAMKKDTVKVEVWAVGVPNINKSTQQYSLLPNPNSGVFEIIQSVVDDENVSASIYDMLGRKIYQSAIIFRNGRADMQPAGLSPGLYILRIGDGGNQPLRFEVR